MMIYFVVGHRALKTMPDPTSITGIMRCRWDHRREWWTEKEYMYQHDQLSLIRMEVVTEIKMYLYMSLVVTKSSERLVKQYGRRKK